MTDYYQTLGVQRNATEDEIKRAYRKAAMKHHPDRGGDQVKFQEIQEAYATLGDPQKRQQYDNPHPHVRINVNGRPWQGEGAPFDFDTIFEMFGARMGGRGQQARQQRISIWIPLRDAVSGGPRPISVATPQGTTTLEITIPRGIHDNENVRYPGLAPGGQDLIVNFRVHPDPQWQRNGLDLYTERSLDFWQLILGTTLNVTDLHGRELALTVPPRCRPGTIMRAKGRGIQRDGHHPGDLLVQIKATMPDDIPQELIDILQKHTNK